MNLRDCLKGKVVIVGVGNIMRGDDAFGPMLIEALGAGPKCIVPETAGPQCDILIDAGTAPENYLGKIAKAGPDTILIADAIDLGKKPGEYAILTKDEILKSGFTTHDQSPTLFIEYLENETKAAIYMLGVQPEKVGFGEEMCGAVRSTLGDLTLQIASALKNYA